jgi:hypothetical protein
MVHGGDPYSFLFLGRELHLPKYGGAKRRGDGQIPFLPPPFAAEDQNIAAGALVVVPTEWTEVFNIAERISAQHTVGGGHRFLDVLHVATAIHLGAVELLSCDVNQRKLAAAEGLAAKP